MSLNKKIIVFGVVALFFILVLTPTTYAVYTNEINSKEELIQIQISEYKSNGIIKNKTFSLTKNEALDLKKELLNSKTIENQFTILKEHKLIPENTDIKDLENNMHKKASNLGITEDIQPERTRIKLPILLKFLNKVNIVYLGTGSLNIGLKFIMRIINILPFINLPTLDFTNICGGLIGITQTQGILSNNTLITFPGIVGMIGFVGYRIKFPFFINIYTGFSAVIFGLGLGIQIKN
jgi:hypothetical protein